MAISISKSKLKAHMLEVFRKVEETGEEVIVTSRNRPVIRVQAMKEGTTVEEAFADVYGQLIFLGDPNEPTIEEWGDLV